MFTAIEPPTLPDISIRAVKPHMDATDLDVSESESPNGACLLCRESEVVRPYPRRLPWVAQCHSCGLAFCYPQPSDDELASIYNADYYQAFGYHGANPVAYRTMKRASTERLLGQITLPAPGSKLLDIGSALGDLISTARVLGWDATGIEPNTYAAAEAERLIPGATFCGTLSQFGGNSATFGAITCFDVLEHLRRPDLELQRMFQLLQPGGELLITTVDVQGWQSRVFGSRWVHYHRDHLWYFSRQSLTQLARAAGFEILSCGTASKTFNLRYILEILSAQTHFAMQQRAAKLTLAVLPKSWSTMVLPPLREGLMLFARRPREHVKSASSELL